MCLPDPVPLGPYQDLSPASPYPLGATLVKAEYDDDSCAVAVGYTAMRKEVVDGPDGGAHGWHRQKLDADRRVLLDGAPTVCIACHTQHCAPPYGFDLSCAEEI